MWCKCTHLPLTHHPHTHISPHLTPPQVKNGKTQLTPHLASTVQSIERKLLFIPIIFILLRIWSLLFSIIETHGNLPCPAVEFFLYMGVRGWGWEGGRYESGRGRCGIWVVMRVGTCCTRSIPSFKQGYIYTCSLIYIQWNLSNTDTLGTKTIVLISEASLFQGENNMYLYKVGTQSSVMILN